MDFTRTRRLAAWWGAQPTEVKLAIGVLGALAALSTAGVAREGVGVTAPRTPSAVGTVAFSRHAPKGPRR